MATAALHSAENGRFCGILHAIRSCFASLAVDRRSQPFTLGAAAVAADPLAPLRAGFASEAGGRRVNEDGAYANVQEGIFLVADGVGGSQGGVLASQLLVDNVPQYLVGALAENRDDGEATDQGLLHEVNLSGNTAWTPCSPGT